MAPLRELQAASHFRLRPDGWWEACAPGERGARRMRLLDVPSQALATPPVTHAHFESALRSTRPSVAPAELVSYERFTRDFGSGSAS